MLKGLKLIEVVKPKGMELSVKACPLFKREVVAFTINGCGRLAYAHDVYIEHQAKMNDPEAGAVHVLVYPLN